MVVEDSSTRSCPATICIRQLSSSIWYSYGTSALQLWCDDTQGVVQRFAVGGAGG